MKPFILISCLFCATQYMQAQFTAVPDTNFEAYLEANGMGDGIPDNGLVLTANIDTVTNLNLPNFAGITDLTGIEDFAALEFLNCSFNPIVQLDLSQNSSLSILGCAFTSLTSLDLSQNTSLMMLYCPSNDQLTSLLLNSEHLTILECFENQLTSLDLTNSPSLEYLDCESNNLTHLDISQNASLSFLRISDNPLTGLDTSQNALLTSLISGYTNITELDLSQNINLTNVLVPFNPQLSFLDIRNGNNSSIGSFSAIQTDLDCIFVDDASAPYLEDWFKDPDTHFVNNEEKCDALSTLSFDREPFILYPNPTKDSVIVLARLSALYTLVDMQGKSILTGTLRSSLNHIDVSQLPKGVYILTIQTEKKTSLKKIIKE
ncbi:MAG: T9SS type A sorting domain-containing protein [Flavobacteriaceae bacterium]